MSRAPFVPMRTDLRKEERIGFTADFCGYNEFEALGRFFHLWSWCSDRGLQDAPDDCDGYAVPDAIVRRFLGPRGVDAILGDGCDELGMGERRYDALIYLRGTSETVARLRAARASSSAGGLARSETAARNKGRFAPKHTNDQPCETSNVPAGTSEIPDPRSHIPEQIPEVSPARAIQPGRVPTEVPAPRTTQASGDPEPEAQPTREDRKAVRDAIRGEINAARARVGATLGTPLNPLLPFDRGLDSDLAGQLSLATTRPALEALAAQARHAVAMAELEAIAEPERVQFLTGAIFAGGNFARLAGKTATTPMLGHQKRAGPKKDTRFGRIEPHPASEYPDGELPL